MNIDTFKKISLNGRVAYGIRCFENALLFLKYNVSDWEMVLGKLWQFTSADNLEVWSDKVVEVIPENLLEFKIYEDHDFEYLNESEFIYLYALYQNIDKKIDYLIRQIYYLGASHSYSVIIEYGQRSLDELNILLKYMTNNNIPLPDIEPFKKFSIKENEGWGNKFDGRSISSILKS